MAKQLKDTTPISLFCAYGGTESSFEYRTALYVALRILYG
jgi:hypothetical protein